MDETRLIPPIGAAANQITDLGYARNAGKCSFTPMTEARSKLFIKIAFLIFFISTEGLNQTHDEYRNPKRNVNICINGSI